MIFPEVPLTFVLKDSKYQELLWQYTRSLFCITQLLLAKTKETADPTDPNVIAKRQIFDEAMETFEGVLEAIETTEEKMKLDQMMAVDKFMNSVLIKTGINEKDVNDARQEVKNIFFKEGTR